jgi:methylglutaconyl-CoA hydratase
VRAREIGLVHAVVPAADLDATIDSYIRELVTSGPEAMVAAKRMIATVAGHPPAAMARHTAETIARHRASAEGQDGMFAFLEKRKAGWIA